MPKWPVRERSRTLQIPTQSLAQRMPTGGTAGTQRAAHSFFSQAAAAGFARQHRRRRVPMSAARSQLPLPIDKTVQIAAQLGPDLFG